MSAMRGRLGVFREVMSVIHKGLDAGLLVNMYIVLLHAT
jgi:MoaA/NifB/PqqE/SkfB family radical SAM enzyme